MALNQEPIKLKINGTIYGWRTNEAHQLEYLVARGQLKNEKEKAKEAKGGQSKAGAPRRFGDQKDFMYHEQDEKTKTVHIPLVLVS